MTHYELFRDAVWVQADASCVSPSFRGTFSAKVGETATITVCGLGFTELYLNGRRVSDDLFVPVNSHYHAYENCACEKTYGEKMECRIYCLQYDLSSCLRDGENVLVAETGPGWYRNYGACKLCYRIAFADREVVSDLSLQWRDTSVTEYQLTRGEAHDYLKHDYNDGYMLPGYTETWNPVQKAPVPDSHFYVQDCPADRVIRSLSAKIIGETDESVFYDIGENLTGRCVVRCAEKGAVVRVAAGEIYDPEEKCLPERWAHKQVCTFVCDGSDREYFPHYTWQAGQYFEISKNAEFVRFDEIHTDAPVTSAFESDSEMLNWLYDAYLRTQLSNMHAGIPSDCPHIERRGYTGDGQLTCEAVMLMVQSRDFYRKWMRDISDCQDRNSGHIQYTAPYVWSGGGPGGWGCAIVEVPYTYYRTFGDPEPLRLYFPQMLRYFDYLNAHSENDLVISDQPGLWALGEWCVPGEKKTDGMDIPNPLVNNYFFIKSIDRTLEIAEIIDEQAYIPMLRELRVQKTAAIERAYFDPNTGDFANDGNAANAFAIDIGLGDERTLRNLAAHIQALDGVNTGIFGTDIVPRILFENGYADLAVRFLTYEKEPSFGHMRACGANTLWEEWNRPRSMSHPMFGAPVRYLFQYILGIRQTADSCGYQKVCISPADVQAPQYASGKLETVRGVIRVTIDKKEAAALVELPDAIEGTFLWHGTETKLAAGINKIPLCG